MSTPAPHGAPSTDPEVLLGNQGDDDVHPDVLAYSRTLVGKVTPYRLRWLQRQYERGLLQRAAAEDWTAALVVSGPHGSRTADPQGDRIAAKITRRRDAA